MLRLLLVLFISTSFLTASNAQKWKTIHGEGDVVKEVLDIASFKGVSLGFHGDIYITQGSPQKVEVEGQKNIIDNNQGNKDYIPLVMMAVIAIIALIFVGFFLIKRRQK